MAEQIVWEGVLRRAASAGKRAILQNYDDASRHKVVKRGVGGDLTLRIDEVSERAIHDSLKSDLGEGSFVFLSEELGEVKVESGDSLPLVICDPLDGSHNAQVGIPFFSLSLCVIEPKKKRTFGNVSHGLVTSIKTEDEYFASKGGGAYHNGTRLPKRPRTPARIETMLVETGDIDFLRDKLIKRLSLKLIYKPRILGSAALSFCLLADGSAGGYIFAQPGGARTIDSPAGYLIAREAGCVFADLSGKHRNVDGVEVGFDSRLDLIGAPNAKTLAKLKKLVRIS
jgi:fructose-1,6-bisphosphatase/inositol monophosphatase family enzyme